MGYCIVNRTGPIANFGWAFLVQAFFGDKPKYVGEAPLVKPWLYGMINKKIFRFCLFACLWHYKYIFIILALFEE